MSEPTVNLRIDGEDNALVITEIEDGEEREIRANLQPSMIYIMQAVNKINNKIAFLDQKVFQLEEQIGDDDDEN